MHSGHVLRTSSERRKSLLPSRREIRNRHFSFLQIKNSSTPSLPLRTDCFGTTREAGAARNLVSGPEFSILFSTIKFNPITRIQRRELRLACAGNHRYRPRAKISARPPVYGTSRRCVQCRKLRTANHVLVCPLTFSGRRHRLPLHPWIPRMQAGLNGTRLRAISPRLEYYRHNEVAIS